MQLSTRSHTKNGDCPSSSNVFAELLQSIPRLSLATFRLIGSLLRPDCPLQTEGVSIPFEIRMAYRRIVNLPLYAASLRQRIEHMIALFFDPPTAKHEIYFLLSNGLRDGFSNRTYSCHSSPLPPSHRATSCAKTREFVPTLQ